MQLFARSDLSLIINTHRCLEKTEASLHINGDEIRSLARRIKKLSQPPSGKILTLHIEHKKTSRS